MPTFILLKLFLYFYFNKINVYILSESFSVLANEMFY